MLGRSRSQASRAEEPSGSIVSINRGAHQVQIDQNEPTPSSDPFNSFSWKDLHSLGEFISNDGASLFNDNFIISPEQESIQGIEGPDHMSGNFFYAGSLGESDIIF
jgi:hypothetical protein